MKPSITAVYESLANECEASAWVPIHTCGSCFKTYAVPVGRNGCFDDDCIGHDLAAIDNSATLTPYEVMQEAQDVLVLRNSARFLRGLRETYVGAH